MGESKKRLAVDEEVIVVVKEKTEIDAKLKEKELEDRKQERD